MSRFWHSHLHSDHSLQDAILPVSEAVKLAASMGQQALALTDHGTMAGLVTHYQQCRKAGILPVLGMEGYLVENASTHQNEVKTRASELNALGRKNGHKKQVASVPGEAAKDRRHVLLLARDFQGYQMLCRASTKSYSQGFYRPLLDHEDLELLAEGGHLWLTTGCLNGEIPKLIQAGQSEMAYRRAEWYRDLFPDRFVIELQNHSLPEDEPVNDQLLALATSLSLPVIASHDVHYGKAEDKALHDFFKRMCFKKEIGEAEFNGDSFHLTSEEEMAPKFGSIFEECLRGLDEIYRDCSAISFPPLDHYSYVVPQITPKNPMNVLIQLTRRKVDELALVHPERDYFSRWQTEMKTIKNTGFAQYFLLVRMVVKYCEDHDIFCLARGSASGSLVCFLLGITQVDPLEYGLLFERFLTEDRSKPPDVDLDVEDERRDEVLAYVGQRFKTTQIGTLGTYADRSAKNEVVAQLRRDGKLSEYQGLEDLDEEAQGFLDRLTGLKRSAGGHPAGVITETPERSVADLVPLMRIGSSGRWVTQYDMDQIEALGFVKMDILGLRTLRTIRYCFEMMGKPVQEWKQIPLNDPESFKILGRGETEGIFTFKGYSNRIGCKLLKPKTLEECSIVAAMWRPSCLELGLEKVFLERRKQKWKPPAEWHPVIQEALASTYGIAIYQEQVVAILRGLGFSAETVMMFLRALKKKDPVLMAQVKAALGERVDAPTQAQIEELMEGYTRYGFGHAHSLTYGLLGLRMAWLKANEPLKLSCALLRTENATLTDQQKYMKEARRLGYTIFPVDATRSKALWDLERGQLRRSLTSVPGVGEKAAEALVRARPFTTIPELIDQLKLLGLAAQCNRGVLKKLAGAGAFKTMGYDSEEELTLELERLDLEAKNNRPGRRKKADAVS